MAAPVIHRTCVYCVIDDHGQCIPSIKGKIQVDDGGKRTVTLVCDCIKCHNKEDGRER